MKDFCYLGEVLGSKGCVVPAIKTKAAATEEKWKDIDSSLTKNMQNVRGINTIPQPR